MEFTDAILELVKKHFKINPQTVQVNLLDGEPTIVNVNNILIFKEQVDGTFKQLE